jgi:hypothetical protein
VKIHTHDCGTANHLPRKLKILILGNGTSTATSQESSEVTFTFNGKGSFMEPISSIDVWMNRDSFGEYRLKLSGQQNKVLWTSVEDQLNQSLELQMAILGCLPQRATHWYTASGNAQTMLLLMELASTLVWLGPHFFPQENRNHKPSIIGLASVVPHFSAGWLSLAQVGLGHFSKV